MGQLVSDVTEVLDYKQSKKEAKTQRQHILQQMAADEKAKTNLVRKNIAAQRAKYGAGGMSNRGVTEGAVLKRLKSETEEPYNDKRRTNMEKLKKVRANKPNLLKTLLGRFDELMA